MTVRSKEIIIEQIIDVEWHMFSSVKASEPADCQQRPGAFRTMRWMSHSVLPEELLESILQDLEDAVEQERNLMTEKYARMQDIIPPLNENVKIGDIAALESQWMKTLSELYPKTFEGSLDGFKLYLTCELETYSNRTIDLYHKNVVGAGEAGRNLVEERYTNLFGKMGYASIAEREEKLTDAGCSRC